MNDSGLLGTGTSVLGTYRRGGLNTQAELDAYEKRVKGLDDLNRARWLAFADGEATPDQIAALGVDPAIWEQAKREDLEASARKASGNFTSNMLPLAIIAAAYGVDAMGLGGGSAAGTSGASGSALGAGAGINPAAGFLNPGPVTMGADFLTPSMVGAGGAAAGAASIPSTVPFMNPGPVTMSADFLTPSMVGTGGAAAGAGAAAGSAGATGAAAGGAVGTSASEKAALDALSNGSWMDTLSPSVKAAAQNLSGGGLLDWMGDLGNAKTLATLGGALLGGLTSGDKTASQTTTREPWGPAQPWIKDNIATGQALQKWYQQNPFNAQQKAGMQNTLTDADTFRGSIAPGLLDFANGMMGGQYQRQKGGAPGSGAGYGGAVAPGGYTRGTSGPFSVAPGQMFGLLDFNAINPFMAKG